MSGCRAPRLIRRRCRNVLKPMEKVFQISWQRLNEERRAQADHLLLLSVNPGPDMSTEAVSALGGMTKKEVLELRTVLQCAHLINYDAVVDRWGMHDLVREYVHKLAATHLTTDDRDAAFGRLLNHYQEHATDLARKSGSFLLRHSRAAPKPDPTPTWRGRMDALSYFEVERLNLLGCLRHGAGRVGDDVPDSELGALLVALTAAMAGYLRNNGPWKAAVQAHETAARIAKRLDLSLAHAIALNDLGITHRLQSNCDAAQQSLEYAEQIFCRLDDTRSRLLGRANALNEMGIVANDRGRYTNDRKHYERVPGTHRGLGPVQ
jgi:hypothetical protein